MPKPLLALGYVSFLILVTLGRLAADEPAANESSGVPVTAPEPATPAGSAADNSPSDEGTLPPDNSRGTTNSQVVPDTPLLPQQPGNFYSPFATNPTTLNAQSPQITTPGLYTTGTRDVSQVATNTGLFQAFSDQSNPGFMSSEQEGGYSHPPIERIRLGPIDLKAALVTSIVSDDNIRPGGQGSGSGQNQGKEDDVSYNITPAVLLVYGEHEGQRGYASLVYSPTISRFFHHPDENSDNQNVAFNALYPFQRLTLNFSQSYSQVTGINQDTQSRTTQTSSLTTFGGAYDIDEKLTLTSQLQEVITSFSDPGGREVTGAGPNGGQGEGGETSSINNSLFYHVSEKISFGPSFNVGVDKPKDAGQETFEQGTIGATYQPTEKINFFLQGGAELRQYDQSDNGTNGSGGDTVNPIFSAGVGYLPFDSLTLSLNAAQSVHSSDAVAGQTVVNTSVGVSATQRFFQRLFLNLTFNYSHNDNQSGAAGTTIGATTLDNSQDELAYRTSLSIAPTAWSSVAVYYQYLDNESNTAADNYHDNQIGLAVSAQF
jgi:hypothetical protein